MRDLQRASMCLRNLLWAQAHVLIVESTSIVVAAIVVGRHAGLREQTSFRIVHTGVPIGQTNGHGYLSGVVYVSLGRTSRKVAAATAERGFVVRQEEMPNRSGAERLPDDPVLFFITQRQAEL